MRLFAWIRERGESGEASGGCAGSSTCALRSRLVNHGISPGYNSDLCISANKVLQQVTDVNHELAEFSFWEL